MHSSEVFSYLNSQSPRYCEARRSIIESLSKKGARSQASEYSYLGPFYETYMYAFMIGFHRRDRLPLPDRKGEFRKLGDWKPETLVRFIISLILTRHNEEFELNKMENEYDDESLKSKFRDLIKIIEEYANAGLKYLEERYEEDPHEFNDPFVFVNQLKECVDI